MLFGKKTDINELIGAQVYALVELASDRNGPMPAIDPPPAARRRV